MAGIPPLVGMVQRPWSDAVSADQGNPRFPIFPHPARRVQPATQFRIDNWNESLNMVLRDSHSVVR
jgi:hypothetical protein